MGGIPEHGAISYRNSGRHICSTARCVVGNSCGWGAKCKLTTRLTATPSVRRYALHLVRVIADVKRQHQERVASTPLGKGRLTRNGVPFLGMYEFNRLAASKVVPTGHRPELASADRHAKAASTVSGTFGHVLPLNSAAQSDAFRSALNAPTPSAPGRER